MILKRIVDHRKAFPGQVLRMPSAENARAFLPGYLVPLQ
jgi:hypothetical protein